jgi:SAM-dependent methyltransferase
MRTESRDADQRYMFDQSWLAEQRRLAALETIWDPFTFTNLQALDLPAGARCLEVGGGNGSIAAWLSRHIGPQGQVVATDLDTRFLDVLDVPNIEVRAHDITQDALEEGAYDLAHCRLLLSHLPAHQEALRRMAAALKPGGWLLVEEFDHVSFLPDPASDAPSLEAWDAWTAAFDKLAVARGLDLPYGRRLRGLLEANGFTDVYAEGRTVYERGGTPGRDLLLLSIQSVRPHLVATGAITDAQVDKMVEMLSDPGFIWQSQIMVAARGRKPA